ncbi:MAG: hypothetical protein QNK23_01000 [Crocinitomicaceae bacterium]|nr:hypothetical protein [Crocinitomicaceae bacterium]
MKNTEVPHLEKQIFMNQKPIRIMTMVLLGTIIASVLAFVWATIYWEDYSETWQFVESGNLVDTGLAPSVYKWSIIVGIGTTILYVLVKKLIDTDIPILGVSQKGVYVNQTSVRRTFLEWNEIKDVQLLKNGNLDITLNSPEEILKRQPKIIRHTFKEAHIKAGNPVDIINFTSDDDFESVVQLILKYSAAEEAGSSKVSTSGVTSPKQLLNNVVWAIRGSKFLTQDAFEKELQDYSVLITKKKVENSTIQQLSEITVVYEDFASDEDDPVFTLTADNGVSFSVVELLYKMHNQLVNHLKDRDHVYFEGLHLGSPGEENKPPVYFLSLGS